MTMRKKYKLIRYSNEPTGNANWAFCIEDDEGNKIYEGPYSFSRTPFLADAELIVRALNYYEEHNMVNKKIIEAHDLVIQYRRRVRNVIASDGRKYSGFVGRKCIKVSDLPREAQEYILGIIRVEENEANCVIVNEEVQ